MREKCLFKFKRKVLKKMTVKTKITKVVIEDVDGSPSSGSESEHSNSEILDSDPDTEAIDEDSRVLLNEGWADSIAKILRTNKPKRKKTLVLSKAKKLTDPVKKVKTENYEIATIDGQVKKEETIIEEKVSEKDLPRKKKRVLPNLRVKPNILEKDRERTLQKIATKGVVQLFNAVRMQQKDISKKLDEAGPLEVRKEKVLKNIDKRAFLDVLMGEKSSIVDDEFTNKDKNQKQTTKDKNQKNERKREPSWNVLRDDFLMSAKMKDWDKELENVESDKEMEVEEIESD